MGRTHNGLGPRLFRVGMALVCVLVGALGLGCTVRQVPVRPALEPLVGDRTPKAPEGLWVALVMDPRVVTYTKERTYSLTQEERYASGDHFMRGMLAQLLVRGIHVVQVQDERQARELHAPVTLIPDSPGLSIIRPKGLLDFSALGSVNRISVTYSVRYLKDGHRVPDRVSGSGSRTASFFWSNALLQSVLFTSLGIAASAAIYAAFFGTVFYQNFVRLQETGQVDARGVFKSPPVEVALAVFLADILVSQLTAQVFPRVINPLLDVFVNEPRWQGMVQSAHDDALEDLCDNVVRRMMAAPPPASAPPHGPAPAGAPAGTTAPMGGTP